MTRFQPILLGSDINVYGMARAFHEEYGLVSEAYAYFQLSPTKFSRIVNVHIRNACCCSSPAATCTPIC